MINTINGEENMIARMIFGNMNEIIEITSICIIVFLLFRATDIFDKKLREKHSTDNALLSFMPILNKITKVTIIFIAVVTLLQSHGYSITSLIAGFGITGLAVGLGAKETISNMFGSFALLADKTYRIGDYIIINQNIQEHAVEGLVEEINLRSTKLRTDDGSLIIVPNSVIANGVVKNKTNKKED
jgi:MscS family membrane protein